MRSFAAGAVLLASILAFSCVSVFRMGLGRGGPVLERLNAQLERETDLQLLREAIPSNLILLDGLLAVASDSEALLLAASKANTAYAQGFLEDEDPVRAARFYLRARDYGIRALRTRRSFRKAMDGGEKWTRLVERLGRKDVPALFWTALAWSAWLNLNLEDVEALMDTSTVLALMERVLELDPEYFYGAPRLFFGIYYISTPKMAGGGPDKAKEQFDLALGAAGGRFLMNQVMFARYYAVAFRNRELFRTTLKEVLDAPDNLLPEAGAANAVAKLKARRFLEKEEDLF